MRLVGLMPVRNEDWVLGLSARVALQWCDALVVLLHASSDQSESILQQIQAEFPGSLHVLHERDAEWQEMNHRQKLLQAARQLGATHIAMVDADEILTGNLVGSIRGVVERLSPGSILELPGYNLRGALNRYHANGIWGQRWFSVAFADHLRLGWAGDRFHHREPMGMNLSVLRPIGQGQGGIMHLWGLNERRLRAKHAAYKMIETRRWPSKPKAEIDRMYNQALEPSANPKFDQHWRFAEAPAAWWDAYAPFLQHLQADAEPWQEAECRRLYAQYGPERFAGLRLFGVCDPEVPQLAAQ